MLRSVLCLVLALSAAPANACKMALLLAIDVSQSIDVGEYSIQRDGLADAILDPIVAEALIQGQVALAVVQWSGPADQELSIPWSRIRTESDLQLFAQRARLMPRVFTMSNTAVGQLIRFATAQFDDVQDCDRRVIDISGDGNDNASTGPEQARRDAEILGIQINGLAIEWIGPAITNFYRRSVITKDGFVMTSKGHETYAEILRQKITREVSQALF